MKYQWLKTMIKIFLAHEEGSFKIPDGYNYQKSTTENYVLHNKVFVGNYIDVRETRDYQWHSNYSPERQIWQDLGMYILVIQFLFLFLYIQT